MSIESVLGRIAELTTAAPPVQAPAPAAAQPTAPTFAATLARATAPAPPAAGTSAAPTFDLSLAQATAPAPPQATAPAPPPAAGTSAEPFGAEIESAAAQNGVDPALVRAVIKQESGFDPNASSPAGAQGLMQLMPATAAGLGVTDPLDPAQSIQGGTRYLRQQLDRFGGDVSLAVAAYNAGPNAVARFGGIPPYAETQSYVRNVLSNFQAFSSQSPTSERSSL